jgi:uncharacterized protein DUF6627
MGSLTPGGQMNRVFVRFVSKLLILCIAILPLQLQAGMIGTGAALSAGQADAARDTLRGMVERASAAGKLQAYGISPQQAQARIAALTDAEVALLAERVQSLPAGADGAGVGLLIIILFLIWHFWVGPALNPDTPKGEKKK